MRLAALLLLVGCSTPSPTPTCVPGTALACQPDASTVCLCTTPCAWNPDCSNGAVCEPKRQGSLCVPSAWSPTNGTPTIPGNAVCSGPAPSIALLGLAQREVARDRCQNATPAQASACVQRIDAQFASRFELTNDWDCEFQRLQARAGISVAVQFQGAVDLMATLGVGGGVAGHELIVIDGKLLEVLDEVAVYLTFSERGLTTLDLPTAINRIVAAHMSVRLARVPRTIFTAPLSPALATRVEEHFDSLAGAFVFHEFGHHWSWICLDQLLQQWAMQRGFFVYPAKIEDDADFISGILNRKAGNTLSDVQLAYDVLALLGVVHQGQPPNFLGVALDYQRQFLTQSPSYSPLAVRKDNVRRGFELGASAPSFNRATPLRECLLRTCPRPLRTYSCGLQQFACLNANAVAGCCSGGFASYECPASAPIACLGSNRCVPAGMPLPSDCGGSCDLRAQPCCPE